MQKKQTTTKLLPDNPQPLVGFMSNEALDANLAHLNALIAEMEALPLPDVKEKVFAMLAGIDAIHREGLRRLVRLFKEGVLEQVITDPAIHILMELYDLLPGSGTQEPPAPQSATGAHRGDIPVTQVPTEPMPQPKPAAEGHPHWVPVLADAAEWPPDEVRVLRLEGREAALCRVADEIFALDNACARDSSSLVGATLNGFTLCCPNHRGCYYDVRNGTELASNRSITCYPVRVVASGAVMVGLGMAFKPKLPAF